MKSAGPGCRRHLDNLTLMDPLRMDSMDMAALDAPRFQNGKTLLIAGLGKRYSFEECAAIPSQWQRFLPHFNNLPGQVGRVAYGVRLNIDETGLDYITGVEVASFDGIPRDFTRLRIPAQRYAVFAHRDHVSTIRGTYSAIWSQWLADSGHEAADAPDFERYDETFDPRTGMGGIEIWIPLKN